MREMESEKIIGQSAEEHGHGIDKRAYSSDQDNLREMDEVLDSESNQKESICDSAGDVQRFCSNCGAETRQSICQNCGVKNNKVHKFCYWCGAPIDENAYICLTCREKVNAVKPFKLKVGRILLIILSLGFAGKFLSDSRFSAAVVFFVAAVLAVPVWRNIIAHATHKIKLRSLLRGFLKVGGTALFVGLFLLGWNLGTAQGTRPPKANEATQPAVITKPTVQEATYTEEEKELYNFVIKGYNEIYDSLKNPDSLKVYGIKKFDDEVITFKVTATNGFGGTITDYFAYDGGPLVNNAKALYSGTDIDWNEVVKYSRTLEK